jgi:DeoR family glycerol-3-phosphate regulon repressor
MARSVMLVADSTKMRRTAPVRIAHMSQIQTFVTEAACRRGLPHRGIAVIEAMPKADETDEADVESTVTPIRAR